MGGAIFDVGESSLTITSTSFLYNKAVDGGAVYYAGQGALSVGGNSAFSFNSAYDPIGDLPASGGAIYIGSLGNSSAAVPSAVIDSTSFTDNSAMCSRGGGIGGYASGGAIEDSSMSLAITNSSFTGNKAVGGPGGEASGSINGGDGGNATGGAIDYEYGGGPLNISHGVTFTDNEAIGGGGGYHLTGGGSGGNGGFAAGGALVVDADSKKDVIAATFTGNQAHGGNGGNGSGSGANGNGGIGEGGAMRIVDPLGLALTIANPAAHYH